MGKRKNRGVDLKCPYCGRLNESKESQFSQYEFIRFTCKHCNKLFKARATIIFTCSGLMLQSEEKEDASKK